MKLIKENISPAKVPLLWIVLFIPVFFISCEKLIEVEKPANQVFKTQVFESVQTAEAALAGLYGGLWDNSPLAGDQTGAVLGIYTDDLDYYGTASINANIELYQNEQIAGNSTVSSYWTNAYKHIYAINSILDGISNALKLQEKDKNRIAGEAMCLRALLYLHLQQLYGDIPLVQGISYTENQRLAKTAAADVLVAIKADLEKAITLLEDNYRHPERIFPNRKVAELILAKVLLLQHNWAGAENRLREVVNSQLYTFHEDVSTVFKKSGQHILWQLKPMSPANNTKEASVYYINNAAPHLYALTSNLVGVFASGDLRKQNWMATVTVGDGTWYRANKYRTLVDNEYSIVFRLEEVYLLLAEALAQQDKTSEALPYLNATRQRTGLQALVAPFTRDAVLDEIIEENRREFFTETGHRFFDLKRMGRLDQLRRIKPNWKAFHQLWPIPERELLLNANLDPQNTGY